MTSESDGVIDQEPTPLLLSVVDPAEGTELGLIPVASNPASVSSRLVTLTLTSNPLTLTSNL